MTTLDATAKRFQTPVLKVKLSNWLLQDGNGWLLGVALAYILLYIRLWPQSWGTMDESCYLAMAYALRHGTLYPDVAGIQAVSTFPIGPHMVSKYPLGMPLVLACISVAGWHFALGTNLLVHLLTFLVVIRLLRRFQVPAMFAVLYLLYPTAVLYSRTIMADPISGLLLVAAFDRLLNLRLVQCGALLGAAVLCRTGNIIALPIFLLTFVVPRFRLRELLKMLAGSLPFLLIAAYYAVVVAQGQMGSHTGKFSAIYFPHMFPGYAAGLMLLYPGMLLAPILFRGEGKQPLVLLCYGTVLLYSFWYYRDQGTTAIETLIVGQRYFLAVLPLFIIAYSAVVWGLVSQWTVPLRVTAAGIAGIVLFGIAVGISEKHAHYTATQAEVRTHLLQILGPNDVLLCGIQVAKVMHPGWGQRNLVLLNGPMKPEDKSRVDVQIAVARRLPGARVFAAVWVRPGRTDDAQNAQYFSGLEHSYVCRPLTNSERSGLPDAVRIDAVLPSVTK